MKNKKSVRLALVGMIIGMGMTVIFHDHDLKWMFMLIGTAFGGIMGAAIDRRKKIKDG